ncbi:E3 ubiquitin-protein ligase E3D-like [Glandiceps talaboti]
MAEQHGENWCNLYVEIRERIRAAHVVIGLKNIDNISEADPSKFSVTVNTSSIEVSSIHGRRRTFSIPGTRLIPKSCHSLHWIQGEGLHFRVEISEDDGAIDNDSLSTKKMVDPSKELDALDNGVCQLSCRVCHSNVLQPNCQFQRVLPLPSENWRELADDWMCHNSEVTNKMKKASLEPREKDCFVGDLYLSFNMASVQKNNVITAEKHNHQKLREGTNLVIICQKCRCILGKATSSEPDTGPKNVLDLAESIQVYKHCIKLWKDEAQMDTFRSYTLESYFARLMKTHSSNNTSFRYVVRSNTANRKAYILLWLLNSDSRLVTNTAKPDEELQQLTGLLLSDEENQQGDGLKSYSIIKILYQSCLDNENTELLEDWKRDSTVENLVFSSEWCLQLLSLLVNNTQHLPLSLRNTDNNFQVSYLRLG